MTTRKRQLISKGKGYLSAAGPQARFIIFLIFTLIAYTVLLRVFQKLAEILQLPLFLPIALVVLLVFIGIIGVVYSHKFLGPLTRIRHAIDMMAEGETALNLRLRDADDPLLKELARSVSLLCEHSRDAQTLTDDSARDLFQEIEALSKAVQADADRSTLRKHLENVRKKQELLEKAIKAFRKA
jgi:signal transduction histidine kinase